MSSLVIVPSLWVSIYVKKFSDHYQIKYQQNVVRDSKQLLGNE